MSDCESNTVAPEYWERFPSSGFFKPELSIWISEAEEDLRWDEFLLGVELGQFQQSSAWARVKRLDGWQATRFIVTSNKQVVAGFQILWKTKYGVRIGYVSKGPVIDPKCGVSPDGVVSLLQRATRYLHLISLIAQPPDLATALERSLLEAGFLNNQLQGVYSATILINLDRPFEDVVRGFSHDVGRQVRRQQENGVQVRIGDASDADLFFELMKESCARQKVLPNPSNPESLRSLLREFRGQNGNGLNPSARFLFAENEGRTIAGFLLIRFGTCLSLWKKGAASGTGRAQPNRLLDWEAMKLGQNLGCRCYDLVGIDREASENLLRGTPRGNISMKSSDFYKLDFGGTPMLLPKSRVWIPSPLIRIAYQIFLKLRMLRAHL